MIEIQMLGGLRIAEGSSAIEAPLTQQAAVLLAFLALHPERAYSREELATILWEDEEPEEARYKLRQAVYALRQFLDRTPISKSSLLLSTRSSIRLAPGTFSTDVKVFRESIIAAQAQRDAANRASLLSHAVSIYRGNLLPGFYQECLTSLRHQLEIEHIEALRGLAQAYEEASDFDRSVETARKLIQIDPLNEESHCDLMRLYAGKGQPSAVLRQYQELERILDQELGEKPSEIARGLMQSLRASGYDRVAEKSEAENRPGANIPSKQPTVGASVEPRPPAVQRQIRGRTPRIWPVAAGLAIALLAFGVFVRSKGHEKGNLVVRAAASRVRTGEEKWIYRFRPGPEDYNSEPLAMIADNAGNSYIAGLVKTKRQDVDYLILKLDPLGRQEWQQRYNGPGNDVDRARSLVLDGLGGVFVTGDSDNGRGNGKTRLCGLDIATMKLDLNGTVMWVSRYDSPAHGEDRSVRVLRADEQNLYVLCNTWRGESRTHKALYSIRLLKYDRRGKLAADCAFAPDNRLDYEAKDMVVNGSADCIITGLVRNPDDAGHGASVVTLRLNPSRGPAWLHFEPGRTHDGYADAKIAQDASWNVYAATSMWKIDTRKDYPGFFLRKCDENGREIWRRRYLVNGSLPTHLAAMSVSPEGDAVLAGTYELPDRQPYVVVRYDAAGKLLWVRKLEGEHGCTDTVKAAAFEKDGRVVVTGNAQVRLTGSDKRLAGGFFTVCLAPDGQDLWRRFYPGPGITLGGAYVMSVDANGIRAAGQFRMGDSDDLFAVSYPP